MISGRNFVIIVVIIVVAIVVYDVTMKKTARAPLSDMAIQRDQANWTKYDAPTGLFSISFPTPPQHVSEVGVLASGAKNVKYDVFLAQGKDGSTFVISTVTYPAPFDQPQQETVLDGVVKEMESSNPHNTIEHSEKRLFQNFPALEFVIKNDDFRTKSLAVLAHEVLYVVTVMERDSQHLDEDFQSFVNSLKINTS